MGSAEGAGAGRARGPASVSSTPREPAGNRSVPAIGAFLPTPSGPNTGAERPPEGSARCRATGAGGGASAPAAASARSADAAAARCTSSLSCLEVIGMLRLSNGVPDSEPDKSKSPRSSRRALHHRIGQPWRLTDLAHDTTTKASRAESRTASRPDAGAEPASGNASRALKSPALPGQRRGVAASGRRGATKKSRRVSRQGPQRASLTVRSHAPVLSACSAPSGTLCRGGAPCAAVPPPVVVVGVVVVVPW